MAQYLGGTKGVREAQKGARKRGRFGRDKGDGSIIAKMGTCGLLPKNWSTR
jgi:hypothetical protein